MNLKSRQQGMTMWSLAFVLGVIAFVILLIFKLLPPYVEDMKVRAALDGIARQDNAGAMTRAEIASALSKRFDIDNVDTVKPDQHLTVERAVGKKIIRISYEVVIPMVSNISLLLDFNHIREVASVE
ncbi:MAG: hypothetical protein A3B81_06240 [Candidatus Muproteobacteria bacterium RIFCSPHIGHO2_02_FULL_65_16]|uniref:DUF4845 domain-containing protein n=1 Tax=Candidatus Muproteobacteria bacterium RIFCSPHIGHO2_02_FULL_65_16 TaxID=1817766 RepID=A0A1F6TT08_9PROT|nr:MAG: hypothetical protein A3B81_06240 [Candidatus Muproteobacteria bacterium RIFCSPHIGHO2_02_FULL_65_16]